MITLQRVTSSDLGRITGITPKTISKRLVGLEPVERTKKEIYYSIRDALPLLYQESTDDISLTRERALLARAQARRANLEIERLEETLIDKDDFFALLDRSFLAFKDNLKMLPDLASYLSVTTNEKEIRLLLQERVDHALEQIAKQGKEIVAECS